MIPPSPRLSARMISVTYLSVTMLNNAHDMSESTPTTLSWFTVNPCVGEKDSLIA